MSGDIVHGVWVPALHQFFVWSETPAPVRRKGRQPKRPPHPFQGVPDTVRERLGHLGVPAVDLAKHTLQGLKPPVAYSHLN